jgi:hypothetical protein
MDLFAPDNLPGVGMGDLASITGVFGLLGLAVTSAALVAFGLPGTIMYLAAAVAVLLGKGDGKAFGDEPVVAGVALGLVALLAIAFAVTSRRVFSTLAGLIAGASVGFAWAEWNSVPFNLDTTEAVVGLVLGLAIAIPGIVAVTLFVDGAVRAGGSRGIIGTVVAFVILILNSLSFYVPFFGIVPVVLAVVFAYRLRRRSQAKYKGLRILS